MGRFIFLSSGWLVVFLSLSGTGADEGCLPGWSLYEGHCYKFFFIFKTWENAEKFCQEQSNGKNLASIEWLGKANFVAELVSQALTKTKYHVWIGLRREDEKQQCSSFWTDGSSVSYENVIRYTKCVGLNKNTGHRTWIALHCGDNYPFVCMSRLPH
uniref:Snaclec rhinocetin subunit alpha n=1 Tax=Bitis rhinoceros TaxID=715877 RepID=SLRA_BITRH|nr:RecName: Full=Snaclec rhinocetin subunit alpha; AltName: Full=C-type lectin like protein 1; Flags: Precursor [Bitis rhinoceros]CCH15161.1 C-type lectin like protein 1 [Bitis rhinoceros]